MADTFPFSPVNLVVLPKYSVPSALAVGTKILTVGRAEASLPAPIAAALEDVATTHGQLQQTAASRHAGPGDADPERLRRADTRVDDGWAALYLWLCGWARLPDAPEAVKVRDVIAATYPDRLKFTQASYPVEWSESQTRLDHLAGHGHEALIRGLGGERFITAIRAAQAEYGEALGLTKLQPGAPPAVNLRQPLDAFVDALRLYVVRVSANIDIAVPATSALAARLLAPLAEDGLSA
ncbi:MAG: hypothetical protein HY906_24535 [Deltaproteobacteria bacterium]|nr:hypothetical protein [Deltaproteobacteria bacterium]